MRGNGRNTIKYMMVICRIVASVEFWFIFSPPEDKCSRPALVILYAYLQYFTMFIICVRTVCFGGAGAALNAEAFSSAYEHYASDERER